MNTWIVVFAALTGYLLGSISFARIITRWWTSGRDVAENTFMVEGSQEQYKTVSVGGNSASAMLGAKGGMMVGVLDILKVFLPTLFFKLYFPEQPMYALIASVFGMIGHCWPIYHRFHGGAGFSAIMGGLLAIDWLAIFVLPIAGILLGMVVLRNLVVANLSWLWLLIPWLWWRFNGNPIYIIYAVILNILFLIAMIPEYQTAMKYKKEGKMVEYGLSNLQATPMGRGMMKIAKFFKVEVK